MRDKTTRSFAVNEAMSHAFRSKYKIYIVPDRGGSMKNPPQCRIGYVKDGKTFVGRKKYDQNSLELRTKIENLYLKYYDDTYNYNDKILVEHFYKTEEELKKEEDKTSGSLPENRDDKTRSNQADQFSLF